MTDYLLAEAFWFQRKYFNHQNQKHVDCQEGLTLTRKLLWCGASSRGQQNEKRAATLLKIDKNYTEGCQIYNLTFHVFYCSTETSKG